MKRTAAGMDAPQASTSTTAETSSGPSLARRSKKGVTKQCPVCLDDIPVRMLQTHVEWELERVEELAQRPVEDVEVPELLIDTPGAGPSSSRRGAAVRARKSFNSTSSGSQPSAVRPSSTIEAEKTIKLLQRHRRARHTKTREFSKAVLDDLDRRQRVTGPGATSQCPVCQLHISSEPGGETLAEHVDRCLIETAASETHRREQIEAAAMAIQTGPREETYDMNGETRIRLTSLTGFAGTGFNIRNPEDRDVDDDLDVLGEDEDEFGDAQFNEGDIIALDSTSQAGDADIEIDDGTQETGGNSPSGSVPPDTLVGSTPARARTLRDLVAAGKVTRSGPNGKGKDVQVVVAPDPAQVKLLANSDDLDAAISAATLAGDKDALITALQRKLALSALSSSVPQPASNHNPHSHPTHSTSTNSTSTCRICLEPYTDPTTSVACWHVFCNECWLRCLGSTKLCPICKHISSATNLRRVYL